MARPDFSECPICGTSELDPINGAEYRSEQPLAYRCSMQHILMPSGASDNDLLEVLCILGSQPELMIQ